MASRLLRRSGVAVGLIADCLGWRADTIYQVGVGQHFEEIDVLVQEWPGVRIIGCEPCPDIGHGYPGELHRKAIGSRTGTSAFYIKPSHKDGSSVFFPTEHSGVRRLDVEITTLDDLFPHPVGERILLWLDCEGSELEALRGGEQFIRSVNVVNVELTGNPPSKGWCKPTDVHRWLIERGFFLQHIHTHRIHTGQWDAVYVEQGLFNPRFCCVPQEITRHEADEK